MKKAIHRSRRGAALSCRFLVIALVCAASTASAWCDSVIGRADFDGSNIEMLRAETGSACTIQVHSASGKVYWTHSDIGCSGPTEIRRSNLDGSGFEVVATGRSMDAIDGDHIYWAEGLGFGGPQELFRSDLDGNNVELLGTFAGDNRLLIRVDSESETVFWLATSIESFGVWTTRTAFDGSNEIIFPTEPISSLALLPGGTQFVGAHGSTVPFPEEDWIAQVDVDGQNLELLFEFGVDRAPSDVEYVDPWIFWRRSFDGGQSIQRASSCDDHRVILEATSFRDYTVDEVGGKIYFSASELPTQSNDPLGDLPMSCDPTNVPASSIPAAVTMLGLISIAMCVIFRRRF